MSKERGEKVENSSTMLHTCILALVDPLSADLNFGTDEVAVEELPIFNVVQLCNFLPRNGVVHLARFFTTLLLEAE